MSYDYSFKIMVIGDASVGKSSLVKRYCYGKFNPAERLTIGVDFHVRSQYAEFKRREIIGKSLIKLQIWDIGGEERFRFLLPEYCVGVNAALFLYDITRPGSLGNINEWLSILNRHAGLIPIIIIGNKVDLSDFNRKVPYEQGKNISKKLDLMFFECSAKSGKNVNEVFKLITLLILEKNPDFDFLEQEGTIESGKKLFQNAINKMKKNDFGFILNFNNGLMDSSFKIENSFQLTQALQIIQSFEANKNNFKDEILMKSLSKLMFIISKYYFELKKFDLAHDYRFNSIKVLLQLSKEEMNFTAALMIIKWFWEKLANFISLNEWFQELQNQTELFNLTITEGGILFQITLDVYNAFKDKDGELLDKCNIELSNLQELYPNQKALFNEIFESLRKLRKNIPIGRIAEYNFEPSKLIPGRPVTLIVEVQNNSDKKQKYKVAIITTNFKRLFDSQNIVIDGNRREKMSFLLGYLLTPDLDKVSIQIRLFDRNKNRIHEVFITLDEIQIGNEKSEVITHQNLKKKIKPEYFIQESLSEEITKTHYLHRICEELAKKIPKYRTKNLRDIDFIEFLNRFDNDLQRSIAKLFEKITYISKENMQDYFKELIYQIVPKSNNINLILFEASRQKSGDAWAYFTKFYSESKINMIPSKELLIFLRKINSNEDQYFIFLDDVIGTGDQFTRIFKKELKNQLQEIIQINRSSNKIHFYLIAGIGSFASKKHISEEIELFTIDNIRFKINLNEEDKAFNCEMWENDDLLEKTKEFLKQKDPKWWNGYKDSQLLVVLEWNVPNNSIGCIWNETDVWKPIFPRKD